MKSPKLPTILATILTGIFLIILILFVMFLYLVLENKEALTHLTARHIMG